LTCRRFSTYFTPLEGRCPIGIHFFHKLLTFLKENGYTNTLPRLSFSSCILPFLFKRAVPKRLVPPIVENCFPLDFPPFFARSFKYEGFYRFHFLTPKSGSPLLYLPPFPRHPWLTNRFMYVKMSTAPSLTLFLLGHTLVKGIRFLPLS